MIPRRFRYTAPLVMVVLFTTGLAECSSQGSKGSVSVIGPWGGIDPGTEGYAFRKVLDAFTAETGVRVDYRNTRALSQVVHSSVLGGTPPDVAVLSSPAELAKYARSGVLYPLDDVIDQEQRAAFKQQWLLPLEIDGTRHIYTVPIKVNLKGLIWFRPSMVDRSKVETWDELVAYSGELRANRGIAPWCMGMGDTPNSGWPGSDMIENIFLRKFGQDYYIKWAAGELQWASDKVEEAWTTWGAISGNPNFVHGGLSAALFTDFGDAGRPLFTMPPGCLLEHQASFIAGFYQRHTDENGNTPQPGADFDFVSFPKFGGKGTDEAWEASADLAGMFNNTPQARQLMHFLAKGGTQRIWPTIPGGSAFTVNKKVGSDVYGDPVSKRIADIIGSAAVLCFDASDLMPAAMRNAFYRAVLEYLNDPSQLDTLLKELDEVRKEIAPEDRLDLRCDE
jgi:alpha-glucoside transport system substrate-binding protein